MSNPAALVRLASTPSPIQRGPIPKPDRLLDAAVHLVADASALGGFNHQTSSVVVNGGEGRLLLEWKTLTGLGYQPVPVANFKPAG